MTGDETNVKIICPSEEEILNYKFTATSQCPVCKKVIKNPSAMRMHMAQTHGLGTVNVLQSFNKAFNGSNKIIKSLYACPAFTCGRTYGTGRYFKALTTLREVCCVYILEVLFLDLLRKIHNISSLAKFLINNFTI